MILRAERIGFHYEHSDQWIFRDLEFAIARGSIFAILGPNGRGKTTLLKSLIGLLPLAAGKVVINGDIGYVPQQHQAPFAYSCLDIVVMGRARSIHLFASPKREDYRIAREAMACVGVERFADRSITALSGGERQLVMIARAVASQASLLILDEPTSALDYRNQDRVLQAIAMLAREHQKTVLFTTHSPQHALSVADQALAMHSGGRIDIGPVHAVLHEDRLSQLYDLPVRRTSLEHGGRDIAAVVPIFGGVPA